LSEVVKEGFNVLLIPHVTARGRKLSMNDEELLRQFLSRFPKTCQCVRLLPAGLSAGQIKWVIARCRFLVAARTHATIAGYSSGVPTVAIGYSTKARGIARDIFGHEQYVVAAPHLCHNALRRAWDDLKRDEAAIREILVRKKEDMMTGARRNGAVLAELLRRAPISY
jgi:polysaccharide pyruvyl transferase WcaK-like protein